MIETPRRLYGSAARIADLFEGKLPVLDQYGLEGAHLYDSAGRNQRTEIDEILRLVDGRPGPLLELCCGNGRTTLPLLGAGYEVVGLDSSPHMLSLLTERVQQPEWRQHAERLTTVVGDMSDFSFDRKFNLIVLGMSTVWVLDEAQRASLLGRVREHLAKGGRFLLTLMEFPWLVDDASPFERTTIFTAEDNTGPVLATLFDYVDPSQRVRATVILSHGVSDGAITRTAMYASWMNLISVATLESEIERAGLHVLGRHDVERNQMVARDNPDGRRRVLLEVGH